MLKLIAININDKLVKKLLKAKLLKAKFWNIGLFKAQKLTLLKSSSLPLLLKKSFYQIFNSLLFWLRRIYLDQKDYFWLYSKLSDKPTNLTWF